MAVLALKARGKFEMRNDEIKRLAQLMGVADTKAPQRQTPDSFKELTASELYCPKCKASMPVREVTLLVLANGADIKDYLCERCGTSVGTKHPK